LAGLSLAGAGRGVESGKNERARFFMVLNLVKTANPYRRRASVKNREIIPISSLVRAEASENLRRKRKSPPFAEHAVSLSFRDGR
jgi:hypothetical protein